MTQALTIGMLLAPYLLGWVILLRFWGAGSLARCSMAALLGGAVWGGMIFWDDSSSGFCCREYPASFQTEWWMLALDVILFAFPGLVPLVAAEFLRSMLKR